MIPAFALSFSNDGIALLHHGRGGLTVVGEVALDNPDLPGAMAALRDRAVEIEGNARCNLILPNDQIKYLSFEDPDLQDDDRTIAAAAALTEATPYALSDLAFDTTFVGAVTYVAAVARDTLEEARAFAAGHGFTPVSYVAVPDMADFPGEPFFGLAPDSGLPAEPVAETSEPEIEDPESDSGTEQETETVSANLSEALAMDLALDSLPEATALTASEPSDPDPQPETAQPESEAEPPARAQDSAPLEPTAEAHPIAGAAPPMAFKAPDPLGHGVADETDEKPLPGSQNNARSHRRFAVPTIAACVLAIGGWALWAALSGDADIDARADAGAVAAPQTSDSASSDAETQDPAIAEALSVAPQPVPLVTSNEPASGEISAPPANVQSEPPDLPQPPEADTLGDLSLAETPTGVPTQQLAALPDAASFATDTTPELAAAPQEQPEAELDERGLVVATAEGALTPEGVLVYLGRPAKVPPPTPVRFTEPPEVDEARQRLAERRPRARPVALTEPADEAEAAPNTDPQQTEQQQTEPQYTGKRPKLRPASLAKRAAVDPAPTALAVVRVPVPRPRPANIARRVIPDPAPSAAQGNLGSTAGVSQGDEAGFVARTVKPKIPSSASVARQATLDNAINLRRVNLIGVYGTPANRRALVRLPSGRYKKVGVGDRVDGGRVVAIGESELRYQKGGRNLTLKMPKG